MIFAPVDRCLAEALTPDPGDVWQRVYPALVAFLSFSKHPLSFMSDLGVIVENSWVPLISPKFMSADSCSRSEQGGRKERF